MKSTNKSIPLLCLMLFLLFLLFCSSSSEVLSSNVNNPIMIEAKELSGNLSDYPVYTEKWFSKAMDVTRKIRNIDFVKDLYFFSIKRKDISSVLSEDTYYKTNLEVLEAFYKQMGYLDKNQKLNDIMNEETNYDSIAGFYRIGTNTFAIVEDVKLNNNPYEPIRFKDVVIVHELTHALQDMNYNLNFLALDTVKNTDSLMAFKAALEGDATLVQYLFYINENREFSSLDEDGKKNLLRRISDRFSSFGYGSTIKSDIPDYWVKGTNFVYLHGAAFITQLYLAGGFELINTLYEERFPVSSEQIMHPIKYINNDTPVNIDIPDFTETFNTNSNQDEWELVYEDTIGEYNLYILIEKYLSYKGLNYANEVAEGWGGDKLVFYMNKKRNKQFLIWANSFDTIKDADEFYNAYISLLNEKDSDDNLSLDEYKKTYAKWTDSNNNIYYIYKNDKSVNILENIPDTFFDNVLTALQKENSENNKENP
ncbi:MAG: hypothetical protein ACOCV8_01295 [Spirochaetota bacterium]